MSETCPLCGGHVTRCELSGEGGEIAISLCCDVPQVVLDNWDVLKEMPQELIDAAVAAERQKHTEILTRWKEAAKRFAASVASSEKWLQKMYKEVGYV